MRVVQQVYKLKADHLVFALEGKENRRKTLYPTYKANRTPPPGLEEQLPIIFEWIEAMGLDSFSVPGYESDDVIASLCHIFPKADVRILSMDKDFFQLVSPRILLCDPSNGTLRGVEECLDKYGIYPHQFRDYQGLIGDSSDGYKGVEGIGHTYGSKLIQTFGNLESLYHALESQAMLPIKLSSKLHQALLRDKQQAFLSRQLATLETSLFSAPPSLKPFPNQNPLLHITEALEYYEMFSVLKQTTSKSLFKTPTLSCHTSQEVLNVLLETSTCVLQIAKQGSQQILAIIGIEPSTECFYLDLAHSQASKCLETLYTRKLVGYQIKEVFSLLGWDTHQNYEDVAILAWLDNANLEASIIALGRVFGVTLGLPTLENLASHVKLIATAYRHYKTALNPALFNLAHNLEYPILTLLLKMQTHGFSVDRDYFQTLQREFQKDLQDLEERVHAHAKRPINVNSPKQWAQFLYEELQLEIKGVKKIKTGFSTDESSLRNLQETYQGQHVQDINIYALLQDLLTYREVFKLQSTYVEPLLAQSEQGKIHCIFYQHTTTSSRLSCAHPNLQNIPMRSALGRKIARGFVPSASDLMLLGLDYSQIELRLLAHFSADVRLIEAFLQGEDIHLNTALALFKNPAKRHIAKSINFALLYGMGSKRLAQTLKISQAEAKDHIEHYFDTFPSVQSFLEKLKEQILKEGKITTLLGHQRHFDFSKANPRLQAEYLREGVNTLFQGSASDLVKLAMLEVDAHIAKYPQAKMLVQVHDEIILEVPKAQVSQIASEVKAIMEGIYPLKVPLECNAGYGTHWGELKDS